MPTKKQRRRHQKARRHEYEYVYVDDSGNEVPVDPTELKSEKDERRNAKPRTTAAGRSTPRAGGRRTVEPPSWRRSLRRAMLFGPLLIVAMMLFNRNLPLAQQVFPAFFLIAFFIPFSYFTDSFAYKMFQKRLAKRDSPKTR